MQLNLIVNAFQAMRETPVAKGGGVCRAFSFPLGWKYRRG
jgi:hypothetical protein